MEKGCGGTPADRLSATHRVGTRPVTSFVQPTSGCGLAERIYRNYQAHRSMPIRNWPQVLNQMVIRFEDRIEFQEEMGT